MPDHSCSSIFTECVDLCFIWETVYGSQSKVSEHADNLTFTVDADDRRLDLSIRSKPWQKITTSWNIPFWGEEEGSLCDVRHRTIAHLYWLNSMWVCLAKLRKKPTVHMKNESSSTPSWLLSNTFWKCTVPPKSVQLKPVTSHHYTTVPKQRGKASTRTMLYYFWYARMHIYTKVPRKKWRNTYICKYPGCCLVCLNTAFKKSIHAKNQ